MPDDKPSFLASAIQSKDNFCRAFFLLLFIAVLAVGVVYTCLRLVGSTGGNVDISSDGHLQIKLHGETTTILNVPAYQMAVPSGVKLGRKTIHINANGVALTIGGLFDESLIPSTVEERTKRQLKIELDRDCNYSWRRPDGSYVYTTNDLNEPPSASEGTKAYGLKLVKHLPYGCLLAFIVPRGQGTNDPVSGYPVGAIAALADTNTTFLEIGTGATIEYEDENWYRLNAKHDHDLHSLPTGGEIYFTINDCLVRSADQIRLETNFVLDLVSNYTARTHVGESRDHLAALNEQLTNIVTEASLQTGELNRQEVISNIVRQLQTQRIPDASNDLAKSMERIAEEARHTKMLREAQIKIASRYMPAPYGIWYLDNRGTFMVTLTEEPLQPWHL